MVERVQVIWEEHSLVMEEAWVVMEQIPMSLEEAAVQQDTQLFVKLALVATEEQEIPLATVVRVLVPSVMAVAVAEEEAAAMAVAVPAVEA